MKFITDNMKYILLTAAIMLILALFPMPAFYYRLLKLFVFVLAGYQAYTTWNNKNTPMFAGWILVFILFNPVFLPGFSWFMWSLVNIATAAFVFYNWMLETKTSVADLKKKVGMDEKKSKPAAAKPMAKPAAKKSAAKKPAKRK